MTDYNKVMDIDPTRNTDDYSGCFKLIGIFVLIMIFFFLIGCLNMCVGVKEAPIDEDPDVMSYIVNPNTNNPSTGEFM